MTVAIEQLYRLLRHFERGPFNDPKCRLTPDGAALDAYQCSAGKWTLAFGCTKDLNGNPIKQGDSIRADQVYAYTEAAVERVLADVKRIVERPLDAYQQAALCSFVFNLGGGNLQSSTKVLPNIEKGRWEDAAEAMGEYIRAWGKRDGKWHRMAEHGLLVRRYAEGCVLLGLDWEPWCTVKRISLIEKVEWQPNWIDPDGVRTGGRYFDAVQPTTTQFNVIHEDAETTPLPSLADELVLTQVQPPIENTPAPASPQNPAGTGDGALVTPSLPSAPKSQEVGAPIVFSPRQESSIGSVVPAPVVVKASPPVVTRPPPPPVPIGQQTSAVDATRNANDWSESAKSMIFSRRFWGLFLVVVGRLWMLKTGSNAVLGAVSDPIVTEMFSGFMVMMIGEVVQRIGDRRATRPLK